MTIEEHAAHCKQCARALFDAGLNGYPLCNIGQKIESLNLPKSQRTAFLKLQQKRTIVKDRTEYCCHCKEYHNPPTWPDCHKL